MIICFSFQSYYMFFIETKKTKNIACRKGKSLFRPQILVAKQTILSLFRRIDVFVLFVDLSCANPLPDIGRQSATFSSNIFLSHSFCSGIVMLLLSSSMASSAFFSGDTSR